MIEFAEFSCFKCNKHFRLYMSSSITSASLSDFSKQAGTALAVQSMAFLSSCLESQAVTVIILLLKRATSQP